MKNEAEMERDAVRLRKALAFKYGEETSRAAGHIMRQLTIIIALNAEAKGLCPGAILAAICDMCNALSAEADRAEQDEAQEGSRN
jgi:hypothetical protein